MLCRWRVACTRVGWWQQRSPNWERIPRCRPAGLLPTTISIALLHVAFNVAFYALAFSAGGLSDALVLNFVLLAMADLPGAAVAGASVDVVGAKARRSCRPAARKHCYRPTDSCPERALPEVWAHCTPKAHGSFSHRNTPDV